MCQPILWGNTEARMTIQSNWFHGLSANMEFHGRDLLSLQKQLKNTYKTIIFKRWETKWVPWLLQLIVSRAFPGHGSEEPRWNLMVVLSWDWVPSSGRIWWLYFTWQNNEEDRATEKGISGYLWKASLMYIAQKWLAHLCEEMAIQGELREQWLALTQGWDYYLFLLPSHVTLGIVLRRPCFSMGEIIGSR